MSSRPKQPSYKTRNWSDYNAALKKRGSLTIWFDPDMVWTLPPNGKRGRQYSYSDAAIQACLTMKVRSAWATSLRHRSEHDVDPPDDGLRRKPSAADRPGLVGA